jgi:hypothetical protein
MSSVGHKYNPFFQRFLVQTLFTLDSKNVGGFYWNEHDYKIGTLSGCFGSSYRPDHVLAYRREVILNVLYLRLSRLQIIVRP